MVPEHLQGDMSGSDLSLLSSDRHIRHTTSLLPSSVIDSSRFAFLGGFDFEWVWSASISHGKVRGYIAEIILTMASE